jgi:hypothetical protein
LTLGVHANQRATDSLLLEALDGRQDEVSLEWSATLPGQFLVQGKLDGRRVHIDDSTLGDGYGLHLNIERTLFKEPDLRVGYRGIVTHFSTSSRDISLVEPVADAAATDIDKLLILENLVSSINLHGIFLSLESNIAQHWRGRMLFGADYSFDRSTFGYDIQGGLSFFPRKGLELIFEAGYSTSPTTSDRDSERLEFGLAIKNYF